MKNITEESAMLGTPPSVQTPKVREGQAARALKPRTGEEHVGLRENLGLDAEGTRRLSGACLEVKEERRI